LQAVLADKFEAAELLLEKGSNVHHTAKNGLSALEYARGPRRRAALEFLNEKAHIEWKASQHALWLWDDALQKGVTVSRVERAHRLREWREMADEVSLCFSLYLSL
jgi:hypothetical protein